ncbi:MAG: hypothetical protein RLZZ306_1929, partial [Bacteroidota bacterium]
EEFNFNDEEDGYNFYMTEENVCVVTPHLKHFVSGHNDDIRKMNVIMNLFKDKGIYNYIFWYYTPMALSFTKRFKPKYTVFDCMDELSAFKFAPPELKIMEEELMEKADIVFTGGNCLYEAKKHRHDNIFSFPSSIDKKHFMQARENIEEQADQANIPYPRLGFFGVLDERFDIELIEKAATLKPEWQFVLIGPVVKIDPNTLPKNENIHYLGGKSYQELPKYLSGWDVALIPFAINESTRFISPTKTPEYLAAGKPVVSSPIRDVVNPYSDNNLVHIYNDAFEFVEKVSDELAVEDKSEWLGRVDDFLSNISWDSTFEQMNNLIKKGMVSSKSVNIVKLPRLRRTEKIMERVNYQL